MDLNLPNIGNLKKITRREKYMLMGGAAVVAVFLLLTMVIMPVMSQRTALKEGIASKTKRLEMVYELTGRIKAIEATASKNAAAGGDNFSIFGYFEEMAKRRGVNEKIEYMKPIGEKGAGSESVEIRLKGIYAEDLIRLLHGLNSAPVTVSVKRLNVRRVDRDKNIDVTFQVVVYG